MGVLPSINDAVVVGDSAALCGAGAATGLPALASSSRDSTWQGVASLAVSARKEPTQPRQQQPHQLLGVRHRQPVYEQLVQLHLAARVAGAWASRKTGGEQTKAPSQRGCASSVQINAHAPASMTFAMYCACRGELDVRRGECGATALCVGATDTLSVGVLIAARCPSHRYRLCLQPRHMQASVKLHWRRPRGVRFGDLAPGSVPGAEAMMECAVFTSQQSSGRGACASAASDSWLWP